MMKRSCPFNDDMNPQLKIHVNDKVVATGVMSDHCMKDVYDRTRDLLFRGARKSTSCGLEVDQFTSAFKYTSHKDSTSHSKMLQMQLTCKGQLTCLKDAHIFSTNEHIAACSKCCVHNIMEMNACSHCDLMLCSTCLQTCGKCKEHFCSACSFNVYDASDGFVCRNCF